MEFYAEWFAKSSAVTLFVTALLSFYIILTVWVFLYRYFFLSKWSGIEKKSSESLLMGNDSVNPSSVLFNCLESGRGNVHRLKACYDAAQRESTVGLTSLSIIATTSPFVGLFGTVVGILESFATFKDGVSLSVIAPAISEALIATAMGILVAIPAYAGHLILKRKAFEIVNYIRMQIDILSAGK